MATEQEQDAIARALAGTKRPCVVDLGAHQGEEYDWLARRVFTSPEDYVPGIYIAVEADPRNAAVLRSKFSPRLNTVVVIERAIADHDGTVTLHLCDNRAGQAKGSSSIHRPSGHLKYFEWCTFEGSAEVKAIRLDTLMAEGWLATIPAIDLLWVDLQGAEKSCILGGGKTLSRTRYIMMEAEEVEMYEGQALKPELLSLLPDFDLIEDFGYNILLRNRNL